MAGEYFTKERTAGRSKQVLNNFGVETIKKLAVYGCTDEEIASFLDTSVDTLTNSTNRESFAEAKKRGFNKGKASLRRKQFEVAMKGNCSMLIWLGKQYLEQKEVATADNDGEAFMNALTAAFRNRGNKDGANSQE